MMDVRGWMAHGTQLCRDRLDKFNPTRDSARLRQWLVYELAARERVQAAMVRGMVGVLSVYDQVWHWYMVEKAQLQVKRYGQRVSEDEFRSTSGWLRRERDSRLRMLMKEGAA